MKDSVPLGEELSQDIDPHKCAGIAQEQILDGIPCTQPPSILLVQDLFLPYPQSLGLLQDRLCQETLSNTFEQDSAMWKRIQIRNFIDDGCPTRISVLSGHMTIPQATPHIAKTFLKFEITDTIMCFSPAQGIPQRPALLSQTNPPFKNTHLIFQCEV